MQVMISLELDRARQYARTQADRAGVPYVVVREHMSNPTVFFFTTYPEAEVEPFSIVAYRTEGSTAGVGSWAA
jgi:hypothetical protein